MKINKEELEELVEELGEHRARATELITVYIPEGQNIYTVADQLEAEKSTAKNIKSTSTRKDVTNALDKITRFLKDYKKTPETGFAIFCGNVSKTESQEDLQIWAIEPPTPLKVRMYRCDKEFILDPLREMLAVKEVFGLLVMDRKEATIGLLEGKRIEVIQKMTSGVPSKVRAGGQCLSPDSRVSLNNKNKDIIDLKINDKIRGLNFESNKIVFTRIKNKWENIKDKVLEIIVEDEESIICSFDHTFFKKNKLNIEEVIARNLKVGDILICSNNHAILELKIINIKERSGDFNLIDIETEQGNFIANGFVVHNSSQRFHRITEGLTKEFYKRIADEMKKVFFEMPKLKGILIGGPIPTKDEFIDGEYLVTKLREKIIGRKDIGDSDESGLKELVERSQDILASQEIVKEKKLLEKFFERLGNRGEMSIYNEDEIRKAVGYGAVDTIIISKSYDKKKMKEFKKLAESTSANFEIVSTDTTEGDQFAKLSGIGAILRFRI
jgi:peptide subunit release factor 1 (eRF1)